METIFDRLKSFCAVNSIAKSVREIEASGLKLTKLTDFPTMKKWVIDDCKEAYMIDLTLDYPNKKECTLTVYREIPG